MYTKKKIYGRDRRLDGARVKVNRSKVIPDKYLIDGLLDSISIVYEDSKYFLGS